MRRNNRDTVKLAMSTRITQTIVELIDVTGLSHNTVRSALRELGAVKIPGDWPLRWRLPATEEDLPQGFVPALEGVTVEVWNDETWSRVASYMAPVEHSNDPRELAKKFRRIAEITGGLALTLEANQDSPGWFEESGGNLG